MDPSGTCCWQDPVGRSIIQQFVKARVPEWTNGLYDWQLNVIARVLDREDVLLSTATGDGKSAIFGVPILVLLEIARNPSLYPGSPRTTEHPVGLVVTPTKGLAANIVSKTLVSFGAAKTDHFLQRFMSLQHYSVSRPLRIQVRP
jgi:superfamily II DNA/RNA helicase